MRKRTLGSLILTAGILVLSSCNETKDSSKTESVANVDVNIDTTNYVEIGQKLALETKSALGQNLARAITEKGPEGAVEFCNIQAIPITDSMSIVLNAKIKRVSDQARNPINVANEAEMDYIQKWKTAHVEGTDLKPLITEVDQKMIGYYPIVTNPMCLQCHGVPEKDINTATLEKIKKAYPNDLATGYSQNELRGIFVVEMDKQ